ncbi:MAG: UvrD-helicase domain-containing protein [Clostridia bacterium]|nr:UvrD-helicase domain-containing protein [Clostridia bacterium]
MRDLKARYLAAKRRLFDLYYRAALNEQQAKAVCAERGPLLVLAGAGSGKTTVLVRRIVHLIRFGDAYECDEMPEEVDEGYICGMEMMADSATTAELEELLPVFTHEPCPPWGMLAITFTNKAAREIRERLSAALGDPAISEEIWAGTFHSISVRILRAHAEEAGYQSGFSIYDTDDGKRVISDVMKALEIDEKLLPVKGVMQRISDAKNHLIPPKDFEDNGDFRLRQIAKIYKEYQKRLRAANALDFDDIIMQTVALLETHPEVAERYAKKFRYVCIDEYQDTNTAQFRLSSLLSAGRSNLMVVGDDDQSIYRFRGATVENILEFDKTFPSARVIKLEQNYRSTKTILEAANAVIANNEGRHDKRLWCNGEDGAKITLHKSDTQNEEAAWIKDKIMETVVKERRRYRDIAILYRVNEMSRSLEGALAKSGIPYRVLGGHRFYDREEIRDMVAYLHVIANPQDDLRLSRIINKPRRKIGDATVEAAARIAAEKGRSIAEVIAAAEGYPELAKTAARLAAFCEMMEGFRRAECDLSALIGLVAERTGYRDMLVAEGETGKTRLDNIGELQSAAAEFEKRMGEKGEDTSLTAFLEEISLISDVDKYDENADAVVLMTIHSAKGLEFPVVFLPGMEENIFPSSQIRTDPAELPEERRLAYVAITRAKEKIYITHTRERMMYGRTAINPLSRFVKDEIPASLIEEDRPPRREPSAGYVPPRRPAAPTLSKEFSRTPAATARPAPAARGGGAVFATGARVRHAIFGAGTVLSAKPMGGDTLYEVRFDSGEQKRLMATYAKLTPLS